MKSVRFRPDNPIEKMKNKVQINFVKTAADFGHSDFPQIILSSSTHPSTQHKLACLCWSVVDSSASSSSAFFHVSTPVFRQELEHVINESQINGLLMNQMKISQTFVQL